MTALLFEACHFDGLHIRTCVAASNVSEINSSEKWIKDTDEVVSLRHIESYSCLFSI